MFLVSKLKFIFMDTSNVNQTVAEPTATIPTVVNQTVAEPKISEPTATIPNSVIQPAGEPTAENQQVSKSNTNVLKVINALSYNSSLISKSAQSKLTGVFAVNFADLADEPKSFNGTVTGHALIVNTFNVRSLKRSLSDIKHLEVTTDSQLYANNLPDSCYRVRWEVQMGDGTVGSCTAMRGSDKIEYGSDVTVTLSKGTFNNINFVKSVINRQ